MGNKVLIGMSGGVDSSTAALLLQQAGHEICGCTMRLYVCPGSSPTDIEDAKKVAQRLGVEHITLDLQDHFKQNVIEPFTQGYLCGETPNPCIECNRTIKFGQMLEEARKLGMTHIATGHYAQVEFSETYGRWVVKKAVDHTKDQSYVLYVMSQDQLAHTYFPLGGMTKPEARAIAEKNGFVNAHKPDSQDICFVPDGDYAGFLTGVMGVESKEGDFVDANGTVLGRHKGVIHYTIGQRRGLNISFGKRVFVIGKDAATNTVTLGDDIDLHVSSCLVRNPNWVALEGLTQPVRATVKTRYSQKEVSATLSPAPNGRILVEFDQPQRAPSPGQAAVFYDGDIVLGGGTITAE